MVNGIDPIYDGNSTILILGSLPGEKSIKEQEYYNNPTNQFWKIISNVFEDKTINFCDYGEKVKFLKKHNIALWDVLSVANRIGSLDKNVKDEKFNDLNMFISKSKIEKIFINGSIAEKKFKKYLKLNNLNIKYKSLTSSSSANTKYTLEEKIHIWENVIKEN